MRRRACGRRAVSLQAQRGAWPPFAALDAEGRPQRGAVGREEAKGNTAASPPGSAPRGRASHAGAVDGGMGQEEVGLCQGGVRARHGAARRRGRARAGEGVFGGVAQLCAGRRGTAKRQARDSCAQALKAGNARVGKTRVREFIDDKLLNRTTATNSKWRARSAARVVPVSTFDPIARAIQSNQDSDEVLWALWHRLSHVRCQQASPTRPGNLASKPNKAKGFESH